MLSGVALTLVVVADESRVTEAEEAATHAAEMHPCRAARRRPAADRGPGAPPGRRGAHRRPARARARPWSCGCTAGSACTRSRSCCRCWPPTPPWSPGGTPRRRTSSPPTPLGGLRRPPDHRQLDGRRPARRAADPRRGLRARATPTWPGPAAPRWRAILASSLDSVSGRRGEPVVVQGGRIEGDPNNATAQLLAGWLTSRCGCAIDVKAEHPQARGERRRLRRPQLDQKEEVQIHADRHGGAVITQPFRPDATVGAAGAAARRPAQRGAAPAGPRRALQRRAGGGDRRHRPGRALADARARLVRPGRGERQRQPAEEARAPRRQERLVSAPTPDVVVEPDADRLARAAAEALVARLAAAQAVHGSASVVLTGGGIGIAVLEQVAAPGRRAGARDGRLDSGRRLVGRRALRAGRRRRAQREAGAARRCSAAVGVDPSTGSTRCRRPTADFAEPEDAAAWYAGELRRGGRRTGRPSPGSTCCCSAWARRGTSPRSSRTPRRSPTSARWSPCATARSRRRPGSASASRRSTRPRRSGCWSRGEGEGRRPSPARWPVPTPAELPAAGVHGRRATRWLLDGPQPRTCPADRIRVGGRTDPRSAHAGSRPRRIAGPDTAGGPVPGRGRGGTVPPCRPPARAARPPPLPAPGQATARRIRPAVAVLGLPDRRPGRPPARSRSRAAGSDPGRSASARRTCARRPSARGYAPAALAQPGERLFEQRVAVGVAAPLAHVGQVGLVGLGARRRRRVLLVLPGRAARSAGSPRAPGPRRRLAKATRVSCPFAHQNGMRWRGAASPRSASPIGPAPTRVPRIALPPATSAP